MAGVRWGAVILDDQAVFHRFRRKYRSGLIVFREKESGRANAAAKSVNGGQTGTFFIHSGNSKRKLQTGKV